MSAIEIYEAAVSTLILYYVRREVMSSESLDNFLKMKRRVTKKFAEEHQKGNDIY
jgi:hypothetical protein